MLKPLTAAKTQRSERFQVCLSFEYVDSKQLPGLKKTKMVMYSITSKLNSTFRTIGKPTADKMPAKVVGIINYCEELI